MASLQWNHDNRETPPLDPLAAARGIVHAVIGSVFAWTLILGLGYLGYRLGQLV